VVAPRLPEAISRGRSADRLAGVGGRGDTEVALQSASEFLVHIGRTGGTYPNTVAAWRDRFLAAGVDGVGVIAPGRCRKPEIPAATIEAIVHDTLHTVPDDGRRVGRRARSPSITGSARTPCNASGRLGICGRGRSIRSSCRTIRTSRPSSSMSSVCTWIRRRGRWCSPSMRRPSARHSIALNRRCR